MEEEHNVVLYEWQCHLERPQILLRGMLDNNVGVRKAKGCRKGKRMVINWLLFDCIVEYLTRPCTRCFILSRGHFIMLGTNLE